MRETKILRASWSTRQFAPVRRGSHRGATVRAAVDREVDPGLRELRTQDLVLDVVETERRVPRDVPPTLEEPAVARLPHRADRVLVHDRVQSERVVGVDPVGKTVLFAREQVRTAFRRRGAEFGNELLEQGAPVRETLVVDLALVRDDLGQQAVPSVVRERLHQRLGVTRVRSRTPCFPPAPSAPGTPARAAAHRAGCCPSRSSPRGRRTRSSARRSAAR